MRRTSHCSYGFHMPAIQGTHGRTVWPLSRQTLLYICSPTPHLPALSKMLLKRTFCLSLVVLAKAKTAPLERKSLDTCQLSCLDAAKKNGVSEFLFLLHFLSSALMPPPSSISQKKITWNNWGSFLPQRCSESLQRVKVCVVAFREVDNGVCSYDIAHDLL